MSAIIEERYYGIRDADGDVEMWSDLESAQEVWEEGLPRPSEGSLLVEIVTQYHVLDDVIPD